VAESLRAYCPNVAARFGGGDACLANLTQAEFFEVAADCPYLAE